jgi:formyl-CoA transferase
MTTPALLSGIRVTDLTRVLAGPYCTMILGDLGADVIKVEIPKRGDDTRAWGPPFAPGGESAYFLSVNRNKRSLTLDLKSAEGLGVLRQLIARSDVLVENFRTGTLAGWGLSYAELQGLRPGLIYATITGYGTDGPYADRPGYDFIVQALGGFMSLNGPVDGEPFRTGVAIADLAAGMFAANAILAALFARERRGEGQRIDISLLDSQVSLLSYVASNYFISGQPPKRYGNAHPNIVPYQAFRARDMHFAFAAGNDRQWKTFCEAVGHAEWAQDERFATNAARLEHREPLIALLDNLFSHKSAREWMALCEDIGIPAAPINTLDRVFEDPQVIARQMKIEVEHPTAGHLPLVASPLKIPTAPTSVRLPPPLLGEHSREILEDLLGLSGDDIQALEQAGVT